jgi:predicted Zn-dependent peptidase
LNSDWQIGTLSNGVRVVTTPMPDSQSVSVNVFIGAGSRGEDERYNGLFHYLEHMLFKGTASRPDAIQIAEAVEGVGGVLNAYTTKEMTCYWNRVPFDQFSPAIDVLSDMLRNSLLSTEEIDRERTVVQQEIKRGYDVPGQWTGELLSLAAYGDQPIGRSIAGTVESVEGIGRDDFIAHMQRWYVPERIVLSVAGNITHEQTMEAAQRLLGDLPRQPADSFSPADNALPQERIKVEWRDISQANLALAFRALSRTDPDRYPLLVLNNVLGRGMSSRLFREVRERRGLAYSVGSAVSRHADIGLFSISAGVSPEHAVEATTVIIAECDRMVSEPVPPEELTKARDYAIGNFRLGLETSMALGQRSGEALLLDNEIEPIESVVDHIRAVGAADIQRVAARVFRRDNIAAAAVGQLQGEDIERAIAA